MIYLSDDYIDKYQNVLGYLIGRAMSEGFSLKHIEKTISYSSAFINFENSDITEIAFLSKELISNKLFGFKSDNRYEYSPYGVYGWLGYTYIHLFFDLRITFESLFIVLPIDTAIKMYHLYHEMDYRQTLDAVKNGIRHSYLNMIMETKNVSSSKLSRLSQVKLSTISALRYGKRDINKLESLQLLKIAHALKIKVTSLLTDIDLLFDR